ncbi:MAG: fibronectin type III domain-containing protein, partial [Dehalococcoidales bacterium]|nr:fibronectin type III domain-containing protein [Dehalococcoidales bacterium]
MRANNLIRRSKLHWHLRWSFLIAIVVLLIMPMSVAGADEDIGGSFTIAIVISSVQASDITTQGVKISWGTDVSSTSQIFYDTTSRDGINDYAYNTAEDTSLIINHTLRLTGLLPSTKYFFRVRSYVNSIEAVSDEFNFVTSTPSTGPEPG